MYIERRELLPAFSFFRPRSNAMKVTQNKVAIERTASGSKPALSLLVSVYNNTRFFDLVWASIEAQTFRDVEVVICDDGSTETSVRHMLDRIEHSSLACSHCWHDDQGFRKNRILNAGVLTASADYLVFIDGDCILHPRFLAEHAACKRDHAVLAGRRLELSEQISNELTPELVTNGYLQKNLLRIMYAIRHQPGNNGSKGIYIPSSTVRALRGSKQGSILGCNFSLHRSDLLSVNGFDTRYEGPGYGEDSDLELRLRASGVEIVPFSNAAVQYHLWHRVQERSSPNAALYAQAVASAQARTPHGIAEQQREEEAAHG